MLKSLSQEVREGICYKLREMLLRSQSTYIHFGFLSVPTETCICKKEGIVRELLLVTKFCLGDN